MSDNHDNKPRLKSLRQDKHLSQKQVAAYLGIPQQTYSNYERDTREIPAIHVVMLSRLYHVDADYLLGMKDTSTDSLDLNDSFAQGLSLKAILSRLLRLNPHRRQEFIRFLSYLTGAQRK